MYKKTVLIIIITSVFVAGCAGPAKRNKWQKEPDFKNHRPVYYNEFVEGGGMMNDENENQIINPLKKQVQDALNDGQIINHIK